jgi:hypothetical protein
MVVGLGIKHLVMVAPTDLVQPPAYLAPLVRGGIDSTIIDAVDPARISPADVSQFIVHSPMSARTNDRYPRLLLAELRSHVQALDAVIEAEIYPALVVDATAEPAPVGHTASATPPVDAEILLLGGYRRARTEPSGPQRWVPAITGWYGVLAYIVNSPAAAIALRHAWRAEDAEPDIAWNVPLAASRSAGIEPPILVDTALLAHNPRPHAAAPGCLSGAPIWWINLDRRPDRRRSVLAQLGDWPGSLTRLQAPDGLDLPDWQIRDYASLQPDLPWRLRGGDHLIRGEIACTRGHGLAMTAILDAGIYPAIVVEDDIMLGPSWAQWTPPPGWDLLTMGSRLSKATVQARAGLPLDPGWHQHRPGEIWHQMHAYAVANEATAAALHRAARAETSVIDLAWHSVLSTRACYLETPRSAVQQRADSDLRPGTAPDRRPA